jgi:hypothetical protein
MSNRVSLAALSRELTALTGKPAPGYRRLWNMVVNGELPVDQVNGRYIMDVQAVAEKLGLTADRVIV